MATSASGLNLSRPTACSKGNGNHSGNGSKGGHHYRTETDTDAFNGTFIRSFSTITMMLVKVDQQNGIFDDNTKQEQNTQAGLAYSLAYGTVACPRRHQSWKGATR